MSGFYLVYDVTDQRYYISTSETHYEHEFNHIYDFFVESTFMQIGYQDKFIVNLRANSEDEAIKNLRKFAVFYFDEMEKAVKSEKSEIFNFIDQV